MASGTPPTVGPTENGPVHPEVSSRPVSGATGSVLSADALAPPMTEQRVEMLLTELGKLVPLLSEAATAAVLVRVRGMVSSAASAEAAGGDGGSPPRPEQLSFDQAGVLMLASGAQEDDARSEAGSIGSAGDVATSAAIVNPLDPDYLRHEEEGEEGEADDPRADHSGWGDLDIDVVGWQPSRDAAAGGFDMAMNAAADSVIVAYDPTTRERRGRSERNDLGLSANGRVMYCDFHDHRCGVAHACMAVDMLQQRSIYELVEKHRKLRREKPRDDPDGRRARHALYKAVIAWQWANPLGAENRVRLPTCVLHRVRRLFPNPRCCVGTCDVLVECERAGALHWVSHGRGVACDS